MNNTPNPEERKRIVDASLNIIKRNSPNLILPKPKDELDLLMEEVEQCTINVRNLYTPIHAALQATGKSIDPKLCFNQLHRFYIDQFRSFDKDKLIFICALVHAQILKDTIV